MRTGTSDAGEDLSLTALKRSGRDRRARKCSQWPKMAQFICHRAPLAYPQNDKLTRHSVIEFLAEAELQTPHGKDGRAHGCERRGGCGSVAKGVCGRHFFAAVRFGELEAAGHCGPVTDTMRMYCSSVYPFPGSRQRTRLGEKEGGCDCFVADGQWRREQGWTSRSGAHRRADLAVRQTSAPASQQRGELQDWASSARSPGRNTSSVMLMYASLACKDSLWLHVIRRAAWHLHVVLEVNPGARSSYDERRRNSGKLHGVRCQGTQPCNPSNVK
nr:hypothetical protein CFP56_19325 [Quercus suber]